MERTQEPVLERCKSVMRTDTTLESLKTRYPKQWTEVASQIEPLLKVGDVKSLHEHVMRSKGVLEHWSQRIAKARGEPRVAAEGLPHLARSRMATLAIERELRAALARPKAGEGRARPLDAWIAQRLLFARDRSRKAVGARWFAFWWARIGRPSAVVATIQRMGLYCVYTKDLTRGIAALIGDRVCVEVGAGDGTLSQLLEAEGVRVHASDDQSWASKVKYPPWVEKLDATEALATYDPAVVVCSWPPPGNRFEAEILRRPGVELYVVIGSRHRFACGNWDAYEAQQGFDWGADEKLTRWVMPPGTDPVVLVFRRKA